MKTCTKCKIEKPLIEFTKDAASSDGLSWNCRPCRNEYASNRRATARLVEKTPAVLSSSSAISPTLKRCSNMSDNFTPELDRLYCWMLVKNLDLSFHRLRDLLTGLGIEVHQDEKNAAYVSKTDFKAMLYGFADH